jgi:hypothetical protein
MSHADRQHSMLTASTALGQAAVSFLFHCWQSALTFGASCRLETSYVQHRCERGEVFDYTTRVHAVARVRYTMGATTALPVDHVRVKAAVNKRAKPGGAK